MSKNFSLPAHFLLLSDDDIPDDVLIECQARFREEKPLLWQFDPLIQLTKGFSGLGATPSRYL
jgi:hypothetical protein